jgi:hypothetical protein
MVIESHPYQYRVSTNESVKLSVFLTLFGFFVAQKDDTTANDTNAFSEHPQSLRPGFQLSTSHFWPLVFAFVLRCRWID